MVWFVCGKSVLLVWSIVESLSALLSYCYPLFFCGELWVCVLWWVFEYLFGLIEIAKKFMICDFVLGYSCITGLVRIFWGMSQKGLIYSFVAKGTVVLAEHTSFIGNFSTIAVQCLQKLPSNSSKYTYSCDGYTFNFLIDSGFGNSSWSCYYCSYECCLVSISISLCYVFGEAKHIF